MTKNNKNVKFNAKNVLNFACAQGIALIGGAVVAGSWATVITVNTVSTTCDAVGKLANYFVNVEKELFNDYFVENEEYLEDESL